MMWACVAAFKLSHFRRILNYNILNIQILLPEKLKYLPVFMSYFPFLPQSEVLTGVSDWRVWRAPRCLGRKSWQSLRRHKGETCWVTAGGMCASVVCVVCVSWMWCNGDILTLFVLSERLSGPLQSNVYIYFLNLLFKQSHDFWQNYMKKQKKSVKRTKLQQLL